MSLDVYLVQPRSLDVTCPHCKATLAVPLPGEQVYEANIAHNLSAMAEEAGIYLPLWRPGEVGITHARQLIEPLTAGLALLKSDRARFERLNAKNGRGTYDPFVLWVERYLAACVQHQDAMVEASR